MKKLFHHLNVVETEVKRRIKLTIAAYAYEFTDNTIMSDDEFDSECKKINTSVKTDRPDLDDWWCKEFKPFTGQWIHKHPNLNRIKKLYNEYYERKTI